MASLSLLVFTSLATSAGAHPSVSIQWRKRVHKLAPMAWKPRNWGGVALSRDGRRLFVPSAAGITAHRLSDGKQMWRHKVPDAVQGRPAQRDGVLYLASSGGDVYALDAISGRSLWAQPTRLNSAVYAPVAVGKRHVYVMSDPGRLTAIDRGSGTIAWRHHEQIVREFLVEGQGGALVVDEVVYAGMPSGKLLALATRDGGSVWEVQLGDPRKSAYTDLDTTPALAHMPDGEPVILAAAYNTGLSALGAADGHTVWRYPGEGYGDPVAAKGRVYTISSRGVFHVISLGSGRRLLARRLPGQPSGRLSLAGELVLIPSGEGLMIASIQTAQILHRIVDEFGFAGAPLVIGDRILAVSNGGLALSMRLSR